MARSKVCKRQFISDVAKRSGLPVHVVRSVFDVCLDQLCDIVSDGQALTLSGFGSFYLQRHRGHPVQFDGRVETEDYVTFKFSASNSMKRKFRAMDAEGKISGVAVARKR